MRIFLLLACVFCICSIPATAQLEANNWYWGNGQSVQFLPTLKLVQDSNHRSDECAISISDINSGELRFYSSIYTNPLAPLHSIKLQDKNHDFITPTPIRGNPTCSEGLLAVPDPANCYRYYVFSLDQRSGSVAPSVKTRLSYTVVDIQNGFPVIVSRDNFLIEDFLTEGLSGTIQQNGRDFWVVVCNFKTATFISIPVTDLGINGFFMNLLASVNFAIQ